MKKILIIEDEKSLVHALTKKLQDSGFSVSAVYDGQEVSTKIAQDKPDLILLDLILPVLDGVSVLKNLKSSEETKDIPIIVLTNLSTDEKVAEVLKAGGTDYLVKVDYSLEDVVKVVKKRLNIL